ncbi:hypothetical protein IX51_07900 [uncultured archaeon]|nr:hypothetical protein IX51_07900 [uncultured archaeon]
MEHVLQDQKRSMMDIRVFSIIYLITAAIGTGDFIYRYTVGGQFTFGYFSNIPNVNPGQVQSAFAPYLYIFEILGAISAIVTLVSIFFLRSGFKTLFKHDKEFGTPVTGTTLIFAGLIIVVVGVFVLVALLLTMLPGLLQNPPVFSLSNIAAIGGVGIIVAIGAILLLVGLIMGILIGLHRLAVKFEDGMFEAAWILYIIAFFFSPIGLIAAYLSLEGTNHTMKRLDEAISQV